MKIPWDFVEKYYPNYYSCDTIQKANYLGQLMTESYESGSGAEDLLYREYRGDINAWEIEVDYHETMTYVYEQAIQGYILSLQTN